jgi:hypothetical protein
VKYKIPEGTWITRFGNNPDIHANGGVQRIVTTKEVVYIEEDKRQSLVDFDDHTTTAVSFTLPLRALPWKWIAVRPGNIVRVID